MARLAGWSKRIKVTASNTNVDADLTHFPHLIKLSASCGTGAQDLSAVFDELTSDANRFKIAVTLADGTTQIYAEIEKWDDANELALLWVSKTATVILDTDAPTEFYLYFDSEHADNTTYVGDIGSTPGAAVWDTAAKLVQHMAEDPSGSAPQMTDSTSNNNDGTSAGSMTSGDLVAGKVGNALIFDGDDSIDCGSGESLDIIDAYTLEIWFKTTTEAHMKPLSKGSTGTSYGYQLGYRNDGVYDRLYVGTDGGYAYKEIADLDDGNWHHVVGTYDGSGDEGGFVLYHDGADVGALTEAGTAGDPGSTDEPLTIGGKSADGSMVSLFTGTLDEARVSTGVRSAAWVKANFYVQTDAINSFGYIEIAGAVAISSVSSLLAVGDRTRFVIAAIQSIVSLTADGDRIASALAAIQSVVSITSDGDRIASGVVGIASIASMLADPTRIRRAVTAINAISSLLADPSVWIPGACSISAVSSIAVDGDRIASAIAAIQSVASLTSDGDMIASALVAIAIIASLTADPLRIRPGVAGIDSISSLLADGDLVRKAIVAIASIASLLAVGDKKAGGAVDILAAASLLADGDRIAGGVAAIQSIASMTAAGNRIAAGIVAIAVIASMLADPTRIRQGAVTISATSELEAIAIAYITQSFGYTGTLTAGDVLVIDTDAMTVKLNGSSTRPLMTGTFPLLYVGTNELRYADGGEVPDLDFETKHEPRYL